MSIIYLKTTIIILTFFVFLSLTACNKADNKFSAKEIGIINKTSVNNPEFLLSAGCITNKTEKEVRGNSMEPLVKAGETLVLLENYYECNKAEREDIIAYDYKGNDNPLIKKVLVLGGDNLELKGNNLLVNNEILANSQQKNYTFYESQKKMISLYIKDGKLIKDAYLIFGDNIISGLDSRKFGAVSDKNFLGKFISKF